MWDQLISALLFPGLLVIILSRISYNRFVGLALTIILIAVSARLGFTNTWYLIILDAISMTVGFILATHMLTRLRQSGREW
ncbi:CsbA family protein [Listeria booriae]|uniref:CsbA family protein n=1 Tax=Listeria booriae TaxID=1552123 RepID=UPI00098D251B|nr:CsbA family protein [Listeria booriae]MBC1891972.1 CsbA family protein [Listeria booriae]MBC1907412.1 CsbA family protein [Listeria booriae]MBC1975395.1 CsbA family protein [Listeria booriae]MBC2032928.1 CsbA family protein [Listeria booriae]MBC2264991.1 CsbA family protein [Listeria booriae]